MQLLQIGYYIKYPSLTFALPTFYDTFFLSGWANKMTKWGWAKESWDGSGKIRNRGTAMGRQTNASQSRCWLTQFAIFEEEAVWPVHEGPRMSGDGKNRAIGKCSLSNWSQVRYSEPLLSNGCPIKFVSHQSQTNSDIMQHKLCAIFSWKRNAKEKEKRKIYFTA